LQNHELRFNISLTTRANSILNIAHFKLKDFYVYEIYWSKTDQ